MGGPSSDNKHFMDQIKQMSASPLLLYLQPMIR